MRMCSRSEKFLHTSGAAAFCSHVEKGHSLDRGIHIGTIGDQLIHQIFPMSCDGFIQGMFRAAFPCEQDDACRQGKGGGQAQQHECWSLAYHVRKTGCRAFRCWIKPAVRRLYSSGDSRSSGYRIPSSSARA